MYRRYNQTVRVGRMCTLVLSLSLVFSFGLHSIQIPHMHFGAIHEHGSAHEHGAGSLQLSEYMHLADKKLFVCAVLIILAPWTFLSSYILSQRKLTKLSQMWIRACMRALEGILRHLSVYLTLCFRKGILHTKVFRQYHAKYLFI